MNVPHALVTDRGVFFDGWELPWFISEDGVRFTPGGRDDISVLSLDFFVESAEFRLSWETEHAARWASLRRRIVIDYHLALNGYTW